MSETVASAGAEGAARRVKLSDVLYDDIQKDIAEGRFPEGRLPSEKELSQRFGVSRPIVRQALERLREDGLIYSRQGIGSFVRLGESDGPSLRLPAGEIFRPVQSISDVQKLYEFRVAVEGEIAFAAAQHRSGADIEKIAKALSQLEFAIDTGQLGVDEDCVFHNAIAEATQSEFFQAVMAGIQPHLRFVINLSRGLSRGGSSRHLSTIHSEHVAVFEAIRDARPDDARRAARLHVSHAKERVFNGIVR